VEGLSKAAEALILLCKMMARRRRAQTSAGLCVRWFSPAGDVATHVGTVRKSLIKNLTRKSDRMRAMDRE